VSREVRDRDFTGASASIGFRADLGSSSALVGNLTHSYRAPALEELYNFGPHVGNLAFEVGNPDLEAERSTGFDLSLRHQSANLRGNFSFFVYDINNFVFLDIEDEIVDNLRLAEFLQGDSRFVGFDATGSVRLGGEVWAELGLGFVDAELTDTDESLPRIPPLRGQFALNLPFRGLMVTPEVAFATRQDDVFRDETETASYAVLNLKATYVWTQPHVAHVVSVTGYNLTDELYRNHTSFIKDLAPEIGRGVKVGYSLRFF
jgi:iron complex outermembrane receptor protein